MSVSPPGALEVTKLHRRVHELRESEKDPLKRIYLLGVEYTIDYILASCPDGDIVKNEGPLQMLKGWPFKLGVIDYRFDKNEPEVL